MLARLLAHPYFARPPPKSLDRLDFAAALAASGLERLSPADGAATLVAFTAAAVAARAAARAAAALAGHAAAGGTIRRSWRRCATRLGAPVEPVEALGWDGDALEAQCFGFLAGARAARPAAQLSRHDRRRPGPDPAAGSTRAAAERQAP